MARAELLLRTGRDEKRLLTIQLWLLSRLTRTVTNKTPLPGLEQGRVHTETSKLGKFSLWTQLILFFKF